MLLRSGTLAGLSSPPLQSLHSNLMPVKTPTKPQDPYTPALCDKNSENARRHIDLEIRKLEDTIRCLKSRRNVLAPISRLPPEILSQIFIFYASTETTARDALHWIKVTHVSRHWRATASNCPSLWSSIVTSRPKWTEEMLRRSKMTSLVLDVNPSYMTPKALEAVQLSLQHIARIKDLKILASMHHIEKIFADSPIDAPMLQSLSLSIPRSNYFGTDEHLVLPEKVFSGDTSRLQRLELDRCNLIWDSPAFNGLTSLKICNVLFSKRPTTSQLMDILEKMPNLEFLHLEEALPIITEWAALIKPVDHVISLSHLSHITVISTVPECTNLFNHITFPRNATYKFKTWSTEATVNDFSTILNAISNSDTSIRTLHILFEPIEPTLTIKGWRDSIDSVGIYRNIPHVEFSLSWQPFVSYNTRAVEVMTAACNVLSLAHLEGLYLSDIDNIDPKTWVTLFGSLPKLRLVHFAGGSVDNLISALKQEPISSKKMQPTPSQGRPGPCRRKSGIPPSCFPNLQILTIEDVDLEYDCLRDCLMERCERKAELQELRLVLCKHLLENEVELLKEVVVDLTWDGIEQESSDETGDESDDGFVDYSDEYYDLGYY